MEKHLPEEKGILTALFGTAFTYLGVRGVLAACWIAAMALDYLSGTAAAFKQGIWSSRSAREGLWHKAGMIFSVCVAGIGDLILDFALKTFPEIGFRWPGLTLPLVLCWYILTELGSILENAVKLGAAVPQWLTKLLKIGLSAVDSAAEK